MNKANLRILLKEIQEDCDPRIVNFTIQRLLIDLVNALLEEPEIEREDKDAFPF